MLDFLVANLIEALALALAGIISVVVAGVGKIVIGYIKAKMTAEQYDFLKQGAATIVRFIEQTALWDDLLADGSAKKERAMLLVTEWAAEHGIPLTYELLDRIIEEAVNIMNHETGEINGDPVAGLVEVIN